MLEATEAVDEAAAVGVDFRLDNSLSERILVIPNTRPFLSLFLVTAETLEEEDGEVKVLGPTHNSSTL